MILYSDDLQHVLATLRGEDDAGTLIRYRGALYRGVGWRHCGETQTRIYQQVCPTPARGGRGVSVTPTPEKERHR